FVVANEEALDAGRRFLDVDLNRVFPGHERSEQHEERLAAELDAVLGPEPVLDLHSTESFSEPFATVPQVTSETAALVRATGVDRVVAFSPESGTSLLDRVPGVGIECGLQGTASAADNAYSIIRNTLAAVDVLDDEYTETDPVLFRATGTVPKPEPYRLLVDNFTRVPAGTVFAEAVDSGDDLVADHAFYPFLMSEKGYEDILGFQAERVGPLSDAVATDS
ncbi:MAG: succinylglutamate desuccinylase/aspartoacylase family protein, partial [Candidatus Nanohaloarchaea archaeon]